MKRIADQIKQALSAMAMADVGEVSGRYRMEEVLNSSAAQTPTPAPGQPRRLIALGVGASLPAAVMDYVTGVCRRMQADLLLLTTDATGLRALLAERRRRPFASLRDLLDRTPLQTKEATHLIQCGALDGLGASRAALLAELGGMAGNTRQLSFDFVQSQATPDTAVERLAWERRILGWPVSVTPLDLVADRLVVEASLSELPAHPGRRLRAAGFRLPGWTGGKGFWLGDGRSYHVAIPAAGLTPPRSWEAVLVQGRWLSDEWGMGWLQIEEMASPT